MYKIMLIEDEPAVLKAMTDTPDWGSLSFHTPIACANGKVAIEIIESGFVPDAVITDICMPFVDGVALTEYLTEHCPQTIVAMLTGYDDFSYAHKAIKLRVFDYVLKPITPKSLCKLATRICEELENRRILHTDEFDKLAKERFFIKLLTEQLDNKTIEDNLRVHKVPTDFAYWTVLVADLGRENVITASQNRDFEIARYGLGNILSELALEQDVSVACVHIKETYCVVLCGNSEQELTEAARTLAINLADACTLIKQTVTCGVGLPTNSPNTLHNVYLQAVLALNYRFFFGHVPYILEQDISVQQSDKFDYAYYAQAVTSAVKQGSHEKTMQALDTMCAQMQAQMLPYEQCLRTCQRALLHLLDLMGEYLSAEDMATLERAWDNTNLFSATTLPQLQIMLRSVCSLAFDSFTQAVEDDTTQRVRKVEAYIRENYGNEDLSLNTIRDEFAISISYFSAIFKATTGTTFVDYLTQIRIEKAKELLLITEKRAGEIAAEVGFADPHYFSITFKRVTGLTPRDYRTQKRLSQ